jgi:hypothetical protein
MVLSSAPGRVLAELPVLLPRPRVWARLVEDADFKALVARVLGMVRPA